MKKTKEQEKKGFILISMLFLINLISLLILQELESNELGMKISLNAYLQLRSFYTAEAGLRFAYQQLKEGHSDCKIYPLSSKELIDSPEIWRQSKRSCRGSFQDTPYQFVFELLQIEPCDQIKRQYGSEYWRITVKTGGASLPTTFLQGTVIKPVLLNNPCYGMKRIVSEGWQSWRELR